jgi:hypothetical protein
MVAFMQQIARERQTTMLEAVLEKRQLERSFLVGRCEQEWLSAEQKVTIRNRINFLNEESRSLRWVMGLLKPDLNRPYSSTSF